MKIFTIERIFILLALSLALIAAVPNVIINQDAQIAGIQSMPAGFSYLTTSTCAGGYTAVEDGFIQLGSSPSTTPSGSNSKTISANNLPVHTHASGGSTGDQSGMSAMSGGSHSHTGGSLYAQFAPSAGNLVQTNAVGPITSWTANNSYPLAYSGTPVSQTYGIGVAGTSATDTSNPTESHTHSTPTSGNNSTTATALDITPRSVTMRLCVKS